LVSIVMVFVGFCELVLCEAAAEALISIREVEDSHFETMTSVIVGISLICGAIVFAGADWGARWFGDAELAPMLRWMAVLPVISAFAAAPTASTKRDMLFQPLALRSMVSLLVGGVVGLVLTLTGYGVWALVWQAIISRLVAAIVLWMAVPLRLRFGLSLASLRDLLVFALPTMLSRVMSWATSQVPRLVLGLYWGPTELGLFGLASRLNDILLEVAVVPRYAVARVELRRFANEPEGLDAAVSELLVNMSVFTFPLCIGGAAVAPTLFHVWLDSRWVGGIVPAQLLLLMCVPFITHYAVGATLLALNRQFMEAATTFAQTLLTVGSVLAFAPFGLVPASAAMAARPLVLLPLPAMLLHRSAGVSYEAIFSPQLRVLAAAGLMGLAVWGLRLLLDPVVGSAPLLLILVCAGAGMYLGMMALWMPNYSRQFAARIMGRLRRQRG
jgi:O-antigen/teichoic acid export membrane protein